MLIYGTANIGASGANTITERNFWKTVRNSKLQVQALRMTMFIQSIVCKNDPIIDGRFQGNTAGKYWGEDNSSTGTIIVKKLPANSVQVAAAE
ncbi:hypothetical protein [Chryseobacterium indoltheticum]|uniref:hypothetical protein n=1 Tax=Chryseobacterium indoltheticum TaxID=254 RepID=UPI003F4942D3